jgi:hypothetical protein
LSLSIAAALFINTVSTTKKVLRYCMNDPQNVLGVAVNANAFVVVLSCHDSIEAQPIEHRRPRIWFFQHGRCHVPFVLCPCVCLSSRTIRFAQLLICAWSPQSSTFPCFFHLPCAVVGVAWRKSSEGGDGARLSLCETTNIAQRAERRTPPYRSSHDARSSASVLAWV